MTDDRLVQALEGVKESDAAALRQAAVVLREDAMVSRSVSGFSFAGELERLADRLDVVASLVDALELDNVTVDAQHSRRV